MFLLLSSLCVDFREARDASSALFTWFFYYITEQSQQVWQGLLYHIQRGGISGLEEVSMSALKCVDDILILSGNSPTENGHDSEALTTKPLLDLSVQMLDDLWKCMHSIGIGLIECMKRKTDTYGIFDQC